MNTNELDKLVDRLRKKDARDIISSGGAIWPPVADGVQGANAFLPDTPQILRKAGRIQETFHTLLDFLPNEGAFFVPQLENMTANLTAFQNNDEHFQHRRFGRR